MERRSLRYDDPSSGFNSPRGFNHGRRNAIYDTDMERDGGHSDFERARGDYNDAHGEELRRAMSNADRRLYNTDRRESHGGSAARARGGGRGGAHGGAHGNPYHGVEAFTSDEEDSDPEHAPRGVTRFHQRRGEGVRREEAHLGSRRGYGGGGRGGMMNRSHHHRGYDERAGQDLDDDDDDDDDDDARMRARRRRRILDDSSEEDGDSDDARRIEEYRAAAGDGNRYGGPCRRY